MKRKTPVALVLLLVAAFPLATSAKKKNQPDRAILEKMEAVPCGAKQKGLSGLGSFWASVGVTHINSDEKLCPQYDLRTDDMDYRVMPKDLKHPAVLPVGQEVVFKIKKDCMYLSVPEGDRKTRAYQVVAQVPASHDNEQSSDRANSQ